MERLVEESVETSVPGGLKVQKWPDLHRIGLVGLQGDVKDVKRWRSGDAEFDCVTGGAW